MAYWGSTGGRRHLLKLSHGGAKFSIGKPTEAEYRGEGTIQKGHYTKVALFGPFFACFLTDVFWEQMWLTNSKLDF